MKALAPQNESRKRGWKRVIVITPRELPLVNLVNTRSVLKEIKYTETDMQIALVPSCVNLFYIYFPSE